MAKNASNAKVSAKSTNKKINPMDIIREFYFNQSTMENVVEKYNLDMDENKIEISANMTIEKKIFGGYKLTFKNLLHDLEGKPLFNNEILVKRILKIWNTGLREIEFTDIVKLGLFIPATELKISDNIFLKIKKTSYIISLVDAEKDIEGKWLDHGVNMDRVKTVLRDYNYGKSQLKLAEVAWNKELEGYMKEYFVNVKKSATTSGGNLDLLVGSGKNAVAIELKLSREIKEAGISQKARGQIEDYSKDFHSNLLVVVAGEKKEQNDKFVQAVKSKVDSLKANYIFISAD